MSHIARTMPAALVTELVTLCNAGQWAALLTVAQRAMDRHPRHPLGWQTAGRAYLALGQVPQALACGKRAVRLMPASAEAYTDLGNAQHAAGLPAEALASYRRAVQLNPRLAAAHSNLARSLVAAGAYEAAEARCRAAIALDPAAPIAYNNLGTALRGLDRPQDAEAAFRQALALAPGALEPLVNLGLVLIDRGQLAEARAVFRTAVKLHPHAGAAHDALGRLLSRLTSDDDEAEQCLRRAVALGAADASTLAELGNVLIRRGQRDAALAVFRQAHALQPLIHVPAHRGRPAFSALFLDTPLAGSTRVDYLAGKAPYDRFIHPVLPDTPVDLALLASKADVVFNMICNADDGRDVLPLALALVERLGRPTLNHPRTILRTDRAAVAERLAGIAGCRVPATRRLTGRALLAAAAAQDLPGMRLPLLVRLAGTHGGDDFELCETWPAVAAFAAAAPDANLYAIEYIDYRSADGFFRKYRVIFVDGGILPYHLAIHDHWKVHHFRTDMANQAWMRQEEERFLAAMDSVFDGRAQDSLRAIAQAIGLDYGGVDCGLDRDGQVVVFEANASMLVHDETDPTFAYKNPYIARIRTAFEAMLVRHSQMAAAA
jgi:tetratricopeptide (TPR) repeat protein/glutathione synthase/RimK-type ligase-like ATP-grasp enzyme